MDKAAILEILGAAERGEDVYPEVRREGLAGESDALYRARHLLLLGGENVDRAFAALTDLPRRSPLYERAMRLRFLRGQREALVRVVGESPAADLFLDALASGPGDTASKRLFESRATRAEIRDLRDRLAVHAPRVLDAEMSGLVAAAPARDTYRSLWVVVVAFLFLGRVIVSCADAPSRPAASHPPAPAPRPKATAPAPAPAAPPVNPEWEAYRRHMASKSPVSSGTRVDAAARVQVSIPEGGSVTVTPAAAVVTEGAKR